MVAAWRNESEEGLQWVGSVCVMMGGLMVVSMIEELWLSRADDEAGSQLMCVDGHAPQGPNLNAEAHIHSRHCTSIAFH